MPSCPTADRRPVSRTAARAGLMARARAGWDRAVARAASGIPAGRAARRVHPALAAAPTSGSTARARRSPAGDASRTDVRSSSPRAQAIAPATLRSRRRSRASIAGAMFSRVSRPRSEPRPTAPRARSHPASSRPEPIAGAPRCPAASPSRTRRRRASRPEAGGVFRAAQVVRPRCRKSVAARPTRSCAAARAGRACALETRRRSSRSRDVPIALAEGSPRQGARRTPTCSRRAGFRLSSEKLRFRR